MGILDEAIREHLELKRRHGADDSELKQLEDDAFGPPERPAVEEAPPEREAPDITALQEAPEPSGPSAEEREAIADQPTEMFDVEAEIAVEAEEEEVEEEVAEEEVAEEEVAEEEQVLEEEEEDDDFWNEQRLSDELNQALEAPIAEPEGVVEIEEEEEILEEDEFAEEEEEAPESTLRGGVEEDILEDTPDFLEDSEDDQLWFEQKPPKDFDFDD